MNVQCAWVRHWYDGTKWISFRGGFGGEWAHEIVITIKFKYNQYTFLIATFLIQLFIIL